MRKSRFSDETQVAIIRECDRDPVEVVAKRHKITHNKWIAQEWRASEGHEREEIGSSLYLQPAILHDLTCSRVFGPCES